MQSGLPSNYERDGHGIMSNWRGAIHGIAFIRATPIVLSALSGETYDGQRKKLDSALKYDSLALL